ncbi:MAG: hypothetical protein COA45_01875 [Zetaproteobacteria bacterium]|nr:MAG: hypothetical protein COA45_01875 [Zetaproteobacteria bacterium]
MSIKPEDLKLEDVHRTLRAMQTWKTELTSINVTPESVTTMYGDCAELKGTLATESVYTPKGIEEYFTHLLNQTADQQIGVVFNSIATNKDFDGCVGHYTFSFQNKDNDRTDLSAIFEFKKDNLTNGIGFHHSYKEDETPEELSAQLPDDYKDFEDDEPDALDSIDLG